jgi:hypothetical protein
MYRHYIDHIRTKNPTVGATGSWKDIVERSKTDPETLYLHIVCNDAGDGSAFCGDRTEQKRKNNLSRGKAHYRAECLVH